MFNDRLSFLCTISKAFVRQFEVKQFSYKNVREISIPHPLLTYIQIYNRSDLARRGETRGRRVRLSLCKPYTTPGMNTMV